MAGTDVVRAKPLKIGRPRKEIDFAELEIMAKEQCTRVECASFLGMCPSAFDDRLKDAGYSGFTEYKERFAPAGLRSLRAAQYDVAVNGKNPTMLVWLGKNMLGQSDKTDIRAEVSIVVPGWAVPGI